MYGWQIYKKALKGLVVDLHMGTRPFWVFICRCKNRITLNFGRGDIWIIGEYTFDGLVTDDCVTYILKMSSYSKAQLKFFHCCFWYQILIVLWLLCVQFNLNLIVIIVFLNSELIGTLVRLPLNIGKRAQNPICWFLEKNRGGTGPDKPYRKIPWDFLRGKTPNYRGVCRYYFSAPHPW